MSLTPEELQARLDLALEINSSTPADKIVGAVARLCALDAVPGVDDEFTFPARPTTSRDRIFGGQVIAQAMTAAARTVDPDKQVHSLHAYFLRGGDETKPLHFRLHRDFDGRSFSNRSEEHTSDLQVTNAQLVSRLLLEKKKHGSVCTQHVKERN